MEDNNMMTARSHNNERTGLSGFIRLTTVALGFALALFLNAAPAFAQEAPTAPPAADDKEPDPCKGVVFSSDDNEEFGCSIAAALHFGGTSLDSVRAYVERNSSGKRGAKWLSRFNKNLSTLARDTFWAAFSHTFSRADIKGWTDADFIGQLAESATRLDILHQQRRTDNKVRALQKAIKEVAPAPPPPDKKAPPEAAPPPPKKVQ